MRILNNLTIDYPFPWTVDGDKDTWEIKAANNVTVMTATSYSGDGDTIYLDPEQARQLCEILNKVHEDQPQN